MYQARMTSRVWLQGSPEATRAARWDGSPHGRRVLEHTEGESVAKAVPNALACVVYPLPFSRMDRREQSWSS